MVTPSTDTRAAGVVDALLALVQAEVTNADLKGVEVLDGDQPLDNINDAIMIAGASPDAPGMVVTYGRDPSLTSKPVEQTEVVIVCRSYSGDPDLAPRRVQCAAMVAVIQRIVRDNITRPGTWDRLELGPQALWHPVATDRGANCFVGLSVVATAIL